MTELSKHIGNLLLEHCCVIVPDLGGFVTQYVPARLVADEQLFLPPLRSVGFNPRLTMNDGLLIQSYMQAYHLTYQQAQKNIEKEVKILKHKLQETGSVEIGNIGKLLHNLEGHYDFEPIPAGIISPCLYGLDSYALELLNIHQEDLPAKEETSPSPILSVKGGKKKDDYTITINREVVNYIAAVMIAVVSYFLWATPVGTIDTGNQRATILQSELIFSRPAHKQAAPKEALPQRPALQTQQDVQKGQTNTETTTTREESKPYTIVLASKVSGKNAETYVKSLHSKGLKDAEIHIGKTTRVIYGHYKTESEAYQQLHALSNNPTISAPWVMHLK